jgi:ferredoxin
VTATSLSYTQIACDSCGAVCPQAVHGAVAARVAAAALGWKFVEWDTRGKNTYARRSTFDRATREQRKVLPAQWDVCNDCALPPGPEAAYEIREARKAAAS